MRAHAQTNSGRSEFDPDELRAAQRGEHGALRRLVEHHTRPVFALLSRLLGPAGHGESVEDLAQETMLRVTTAVGRFDPSGPARLSTWVLTIATRLGLQHLKRRRPAIVAPATPIPSPLPSPEAHLCADQLRLHVQTVVAELSPEVRAAFVLADAHGMTPAEVAAALEIPPGTARTRIHRARQRIRAALDRGDGA
ncbi:MAG: RNA polymerase sigma factor [Nannocystales bacterium]